MSEPPRPPGPTRPLGRSSEAAGAPPHAPGSHRRPTATEVRARQALRRAQFRRRRITAASMSILLIVLIVVLATSGSPPAPRTPPKAAPPKRAAAAGPPAAEAGVLPWALAAPISREVVVPGVLTHDLVIAGGLDSSNNSDAGIYSLDTSDGQLTAVGNLTTPTHDAAGSRIGSDLLVVGGGATSTSDVSQLATLSGTMVRTGTLAAPRADAAAVTVGATSYVVGGYDGTALDSEVLRTSDGVHFSDLTRLPVAVRYPAVAAVGGLIYVFGGQDANSHPLRSVQVVDPLARTAKVVAELPLPLTGSAAGVLAGTIYVAGGATTGSGTALNPTAGIYAFDPARARFLLAGALRTAVANAGATVAGGRMWLLGGDISGGSATALVQMVAPNRAFGTAGAAGAGSPFYGYHLLIADRGNDRLLVLDDEDRTTWTYPSSSRSAPSGGFYFPDDAFFIRKGTGIISNQEDNDTVIELAYPSGRITWTYGHPKQKGSAPGYLNTPDDAYLLKNGDIVVADPGNCRLVFINNAKKVVSAIGTPGKCVHNPPADLASPNGDTPLADGNVLVSETVGSWIDELTPSGRLVWDAHVPIVYPSDPQQLGPDRYLVADYANPGAIVEFDRSGQILYRYQPTTGAGVLNFPSLVEVLPSGVFMANDDYNDRMVAIDPATQALVWQYGVTGESGTGPGLLKIPDGFDIVGTTGATPTHPVTG